MQSQANGLLGFVNTFTGGSLQKIAVFALGIMPYITASIILQLLTVVWPYLEKLSKEGELGPAQDHPVDPLRHGADLDHPGHRHRHLAGADVRRRAARRWCRTPAGASGC